MIINFNKETNIIKDKPNFNINNKVKFIPYKDEILKIINNTNDLYGITNYGRVISLKYNIVLISRKNKDGYLYNCIRINKKNVYVKPHRLVAEYFISKVNNYKIVNHKDENKLNNHCTNLEWCNISYNNCYGTRLTKCSNSISIPIDVYKCGVYITTEKSIKDCVNKYHVSFRTVYDSIKRKYKYWKKYSSIYEFRYCSISKSL